LSRASSVFGLPKQIDDIVHPLRRLIAVAMHQVHQGQCEYLHVQPQ